MQREDPGLEDMKEGAISGVSAVKMDYEMTGGAEPMPTFQPEETEGLDRDHSASVERKFTALDDS
jgi:hypothetical protein